MDIPRFELYARISTILLLIIGCFLVLRPFLGASFFAVLICMSTWPAFLWLLARLGGRKGLTAFIFVLVLLLAIALPVALTAHSLIVYSGQAVEGVRAFMDRDQALQPPEFVRNLPAVGALIDEYWQKLVGSREEIIALVRKLADPAKNLLVTLGGAVGEGLLQVLLAIFIAFFVYRDGDEAAAILKEGIARLAGAERGAELLKKAEGAVMAVVYGLIGTAIVQGVVALIGFVIAGVPGAFLLGALTFLLSLVPMGPVLVWGGAAAWLYSTGETGWAIFMVVYGIAVISSVDNFVKPLLMSRVGGLPLLIVVLGVFGGAVAFGLIGLFIGPALLSIGWSLTQAWLESRQRPAQPAA
jgi:predicted PurR-regulated permease PerM